MILGEIKSHLELDHVVNMDAQSVLSCIEFPITKVLTFNSELTDFGASLLDSANNTSLATNSISEILNWFFHMGQLTGGELADVVLDQMKD